MKTTTAAFQNRLMAKDAPTLSAFYVETLGFTAGSESPSSILLFEDKPVLLIEPGATDKKQSVKVELPDRRELAKVVGRLCTVKYPNSRHDVNDKQYVIVVDPEGNEIEFALYKKSPESICDKFLDIESLFNELLPDDRLCDKIPASAKLIIEAK